MNASAVGRSAAELAATARGVVFDKDGTLVDLDARWVPFFGSFVEQVARLAGDETLVPALSALLGVGPDRLVPESPAAIDTSARIAELVVVDLVARGREPRVAERVVADAAAAARFGPLAPLGDVAGTFAALAGSGRRIGIATSDDRANTLAELEGLGVGDLVEELRCGDDEGPVKPDPDVLLLIAEAWHLDPSELLYVGDSLHDLATARAAGVPFVLVRRTDDRRPGETDVGDARVETVGELIG